MVSVPVWAIPVSGAAILLVNLFLWVFLWGRWRGSTDSRLDALEKHLDDPPILPQCVELFTEIKETLGELKGKFEALMLTINLNMKESEGKRIRKIKGKRR